MLDSIFKVTTPELVEIHLKPAGFSVRAIAFVIDAFLQLTLILITFLFLYQWNYFGIGLWLLILFSIQWLYPVLFEVLANGKTPGKKIMGIKVVHDNATPISWGASLIRNLVRPIDFLPICYGLGLLSILCHPQFKRLGDIVAGSLVIYNATEKAHPRLAIPETPIIAPDTILSKEAQQTIILFAERCAVLTVTRQEELAKIIPWITYPDSPGTVKGPTRLLGIANHLIGTRE